MNAISTFLNLALIAVKLFLTKQRKEEQHEIKKEPLNYFDRKFGGVSNDKPEVQSAGDESDPERNKSDTEQS